jgi:hypothetical protein
MASNHSAKYLYIEMALIERAVSFLQLEKQIKEFTSATIKEAKIAFHYEREFANLKKFNPEKSNIELESIIERQFQVYLDNKLLIRYGNKLATEQTQIALLSHALCEAVINVFMEVGLNERGLHELFPIFEKQNIMDKWVIGPKLLVQNYNFPKDKSAYNVLTQLCKQRNSISHFKANVGKEGTKIEFNSTIEQQKKFLKLPYDLLTELQNLTSGDEISSHARFILYGRTHEPLHPIL